VEKFSSQIRPSLALAVLTVYEGQLAGPVNAIPKFEAALAKRLNPEIVAIHLSPKQALPTHFFALNGKAAARRLKPG